MAFLAAILSLYIVSGLSLRNTAMTCFLDPTLDPETRPIELLCSLAQPDLCITLNLLSDPGLEALVPCQTGLTQCKKFHEAVDFESCMREHKVLMR